MAFLRRVRVTLAIFVLVLAAVWVGGGGTAFAAPPAPSNFTVTAGNGQVVLQWGPVPSAIGYNVYRSTGAYVGQNQPNTLVTRTVAGNNGTQYCFFVKSFDNSGQSQATPTRCATPTNQPPPAPSGLQAVSVTDTTVSLDWDDVSLRPGDKYQIYVNDVWAQLESITSQYTVTGLSPGVTYSFRVSAGQTGSYGPWSGPVSVTTTTPTTTTTPPPPPPPPVPSHPERWQTFVGGWGSANPATVAAHSDGIINHTPWTYLQQVDQAKSANPNLKVLAYQNWGYSAQSNTTSAVAVINTEADAAGYTAKYNGSPANQNGCCPNLRSLDQGKAGFGVFWADEVMKELNGNGGPTRWAGVFGDDTNASDTRLPNSGVPDGYANATAYAAAIHGQMDAARARLAASGYIMMSNIGYTTSNFALMQELSGISDYTFLEFCGAWAGPSRQANQNAPYADTAAVDAASKAATAGRKVLCNTGGDAGGTSATAKTFHDYFTRIIGEPGFIAGALMSSYNGGEVWDSSFANDYGTPTGPLQRSGTHYWRAFSSGVTLHVDTYALTAWTS